MIFVFRDKIRLCLARNTTITFVSVLCFAVLGSDIMRSWSARSEAMERSQREVDNLTWSASQHAEAALRVVDLLLSEIVDRTEVDGIGPQALERLRTLMTQQRARLPQLEDLVLTDASGAAIVDGSLVTPPINLADREYFKRLAAKSDRDPYIATTVRSKITGKWIIPISKRISYHDGSFAGIVVASIDTAYFKEFYATFNSGHQGAAALWRDDGSLLVRQSEVMPADGGASGSNLSIRYLFPVATSGHFELNSRIDGITRILSYRRLAEYPLVVAMALGKDEQLAAWRVNAAENLVAAMLVTLVVAFLGFRLGAQARLAAVADRANAQAALQTNESLSRLSRHLSKARDRAEQANRAKSRFLAGMSHELRTPLNGILGYARLLHIEGNLNPTQTMRVNSMLMAGKHLLQMITCVLDLSEIEAEHVVLHKVEFEMQPMAEACLDLVRPAADAKGLTLTLIAEPNTPSKLVADPTRLRQVLLNLLGNAAKFTNEGAIALHLQPSIDGTKLLIKVIDTGPGITAEQQRRLFQDFERLDTAASHKVEGAGLGLALSARLAGLMGGQLGYDENPAGGSVFWLEMPLDAVTSSPPIRSLVEGEGQPALLPVHALRVLVVDDAEMNRDIAASFLRADGHNVTCVDSGVEAVAAAVNTDFDVVLMDVRMPHMDGLEATRRIRALAGTRGQVPVVALTAQVFTEQVAQCTEAGMDGHLGKPFEPEELLAALTNAITASSREKVPSAPSQLAAPDASLSLVTDSEVPIIDQVAFNRTAAYLVPQATASYLDTITKLGAALLETLQEADALSRQGDKLADEAHALAGSAGMFGFERLAAIARRFEQAAQPHAENAADLVDGFCAAITATLQEIQKQLASKRLVSAALL